MKPVNELTIFITGATNGLGKAAAHSFAKQGARLILHGRDRSKGEVLLYEVEKSSGNNKLAYYNADLVSLKAAALMCDEILGKAEPIDVLINNAAIGGGPNSPKEREFSRDGYELRFAINYLAQVLITRKLLPLITQPGSRIVNVASIGQAPLDFNDLQMEHKYDAYRAYCQSKLALIMFTIDLAAELKKKNIAANSLHPATLMNTGMVMEHFGRNMTGVEEGLAALEYLALSPELDGVTGEYFDGKKKSKALPQAYDAEARAKLKFITDELIAKAL
jgi:NAD(P)-dependent dehydrogenase (short-subunit alcohol dehydrogenase family)